MQRIFKATDGKDVKELFELLEDGIDRLEERNGTMAAIVLSHVVEVMTYIKINWDGLTEIHRPIDHEKEWYNYLYSNVSILPEERTTDNGKRMYEKFAQAVNKRLRE